jgi:hypothetical protein
MIFCSSAIKSRNSLTVGEESGGVLRRKAINVIVFHNHFWASKKSDRKTFRSTEFMRWGAGEKVLSE